MKLQYFGTSNPNSSFIGILIDPQFVGILITNGLLSRIKWSSLKFLKVNSIMTFINFGTTTVKVPPNGNDRGYSTECPLYSIDLNFRAFVFSGRPLIA